MDNSLVSKSNRRRFIFVLSGMLALTLLAIAPAGATTKNPVGWEGFTKAVKKSKFKHYTGFSAGTITIKVSGKKETATTETAVIYSNLGVSDQVAAVKLCQQVAKIAKKTKNLTIAFTVQGQPVTKSPTGGIDLQVTGDPDAVSLARMTTDYQCAAG